MRISPLQFYFAELCIKLCCLLEKNRVLMPCSFVWAECINMQFALVWFIHFSWALKNNSISCRMSMSCLKKEWDLVFRTESCCFFLHPKKIQKGGFLLRNYGDHCFLCLWKDNLIGCPIWLCRFMEHILSLPVDSSLPHNYIVEFNLRLKVSFP